MVQAVMQRWSNSPRPFPRRLRGWRLTLFNIVLGTAHALVLFNAASYIAFLPHVAGDLGGVLPSFGTWAQTDFMIALALAFPVARWLASRFGDYRVFVGALVLYALASLLCAASNAIPDWFDYDRIVHLRREAKDKLKRIRPLSLDQASRISGITPADITLLLMHLERDRGEAKTIVVEADRSAN